MSTAECPSCGANVIIDKPKMGKMVTCRSCREVLEVVWLNPVELDWPIGDEDEEDYEYEDDEEYEDLDDLDDDWDDDEDDDDDQ